MNSNRSKRWMQQEESRLINYQHQHRGIRFIKLLLPPTTDREVNILGLDDHIYRGRIPRVREDQLPPEVDAASIDEEKLYKEIRDMNFPPVPPQEPLGPSRRIGGSYTLPKKLTLAPVKVDRGTGLEDVMILGRDGGIYRGTAKYASTVELEKQLRGTKRGIRKIRQRSKSSGFVEPAVIALQGVGKSTAYGKRQAPLVQLPIANVGKIIELIKSQSKDKDATKDETQRQETMNLKETKNAENAEETKDTDEAEGTRDPDQAEEVKYTDEAEEVKDTDEAEETEVPDEAEEVRDTDEVEEVKDTDEVEEIKVPDDAEEVKDTEVEETKVPDDGEETKDTEDIEETKNTEDSEEIKSTEDEEDLESIGESEETENTDESEQ